MTWRQAAFCLLRNGVRWRIISTRVFLQGSSRVGRDNLSFSIMDSQDRTIYINCRGIPAFLTDGIMINLKNCPNKRICTCIFGILEINYIKV